MRCPMVLRNVVARDMPMGVASVDGRPRIEGLLRDGRLLEGPSPSPPRRRRSPRPPCTKLPLIRLRRFCARQARWPRFATLALDGWDTHAKEGPSAGRLGNLLAALDDALATLQNELGPVWKDTVVAVATGVRPHGPRERNGRRGPRYHGRVIPRGWCRQRRSRSDGLARAQIRFALRRPGS
jgi:hypothetical protein